MKITLNDEEKIVMKKYHRINLKLLIEQDFYGHYYIEVEDNIPYVKAKKRGLATSSNSHTTKEKISMTEN